MVKYSLSARVTSFIFELALLGGCGGGGKEVKPGGMWVHPDSGALVTGLLKMAAQAYPTDAVDPLIDHVDFTYSWEGRSGPWKVCRDDEPDPNDSTYYECEVDLVASEEKVPAGQVNISFDVYDSAGNVNLAPHGTRKVTFTPIQ